MPRYHVGDIPDLSSNVTDKETGEAADPDAIKLTIQLPDATEVVYAWPTPDEEEDELELERVEEGEFRASFELTQEGAHSFNWQTTGDYAASEPDQIFAHPKFLRVIRPTYEHVAAVRQSRTYVDGADVPTGSQIGTFSDDTKPTAAEVDELIDQAIEHVRSHFTSTEIPRASWEPASVAVVCKVALMIELGDFPDTAELSPFLQLRRDFDEAMKTLVNGAQLRDLFGE